MEQTENNKVSEIKASIYDTKIEYKKAIDAEKENHENKIDIYMNKLENAQEKITKFQDIKEKINLSKKSTISIFCF